MLKIEYLDERMDVYDVTVEGNENFFANDILVHNCAEICLPTKPLNDINDGTTLRRVKVLKTKIDEFMSYKATRGGYLFHDGRPSDGNDGLYEIADQTEKHEDYVYLHEEVRNDGGAAIALCTLSAINWGNIKSPSDFERPCRLAVRALDELLSYQSYPVKAAELSTLEHRPLGVGIINLAYWLAKNDLKYSDGSALAKLDEYAEAWSYYLIKASVDLAKEKGACINVHETKYGQGILPIDTYKLEVDELLAKTERMPWQELREDAKKYGIRNATLMALMPSETSSQVANATNGIEPPRAYVSIKQSKDGVLKQVVPEYRRLKNKYELLWDQTSPEGYLHICAVLQKYIDQAISVNTSYNPKFYPDEKIPMSELLSHILGFYKYGGKNLYYNQTMDGQQEIDVGKTLPDADDLDEADCDSCKI